LFAKAVRIRVLLAAQLVAGVGIKIGARLVGPSAGNWFWIC